MDTVIAIPTKDRPDSLELLLDSIADNFRIFEHNFPIYVFDDSWADSAKSVVVKFHELPILKFIRRYCCNQKAYR